MPALADLLSRLWEDYIRINPQARLIHRLLAEGRGETVVNDHIAFRTFEDKRVNIDVIAGPFLQGGYQPRDAYEFADKKLRARHYEHPDPAMPKVFISELKTAEFSPALQAAVKNLVDQIPPGKPDAWDFCASGVPWKPVPYSVYQSLLAESEYAGWMSAFGYRANHFTIFVNYLKSFPTLQSLNDYLRAEGFALNTSGGEIKGSPADFLEQSSTLAPPFRVRFADGDHEIPGCYYEFARRYPLPTGQLFHGFVAKSADKIFESTNVRR